METTFKETKIGRIPEEWGYDILGNVAKVKGGKRLPKGDQFAGTRTPYPYIRVVDFRNMSVATGELKYLTGKTQKSIARYTVSSSDVYISIAGTIGFVGIVPDELDGANLTENAAKLCNLKKVDKVFLAYFLSSPNAQKQIGSFVGISTQPKLALNRIEKIQLPIPDLDEQRKIAQILSTVDETIEKTDAIIRETQQLKKGLMQKLFTEGIGHTRFKETKVGRIPEEWEVVRLGDMIRLSSGKSRPKDYQDSQDEHYLFPIYGGNGVLGYSKDYNWHDNTIILGRVGEYCGAVYRNDGKCWISDNALYIRQFMNAVFDIQFLALSLEFRNLNNFKAESGQPLINQSIVYSQRLALPSVEEQRRISLIITDVNDKIKTEQSYRAELEQLKKGLMQVLLTGQVRVIV